LADFGSCKGIYSKPPFTKYISTRWYRAPECLLTDGYYDFKLDIWAVGCVFFEIVTLLPLFPGENEIDQINKIHNILGTPSKEILKVILKDSSQDVDFPLKKGDGMKNLLTHVSPECHDLIEKLLIYNPEERCSAKDALAHPYFKELVGQELNFNPENVSFNNESYFIGSLNVQNIDSIVFFNNNKIYSLNIEQLKMKYECYLESRSLSKENSKCLNKKYAFCESHERDFTINSEWVCCDVFFNLPENFSFKIFQHYKYIHRDKHIYIFGCEDKSTKLSGVFFDINLMQFDIMSEDSLKKFQVFRPALLMKSNIVEYDNHYYYLNCETGQIEKFSHKSLFTK
jgi:serine/threonine protein kinase